MAVMVVGNRHEDLLHGPRRPLPIHLNSLPEVKHPVHHERAEALVFCLHAPVFLRHVLEVFRQLVNPLLVCIEPLSEVGRNPCGR